MPQREGPAEVAIIDEREVITHPKLGVDFYTMIVTYRYGDALPRTVFIPLSDVKPGKELDLRKQIQRREGDLYRDYQNFRLKMIKKDLEAVGAFKPEVVRL